MSLVKKPIQSYLQPQDCDEYPKHRVNLIDLARLSENAERFEDMCKSVRAMVELDSQYHADKEYPHILNTEERNLLSVAYKHVVSTRRTSWRTLNSDEGRGNEFVMEYRSQLESELEEVCREVLELLEVHLIPAQRRAIECCSEILATDDQRAMAKLPPSYIVEYQRDGNATSSQLLQHSVAVHKEGLVFYLKLCGDYYRYLAEFQDPKTAGSHIQARNFYDEAYQLSKTKLIPKEAAEVLPTTNPVRLGLALNYSVCHYEILDQKEQACALAHEAFDAALSKLDELDEHSYKDSTLILMLLRDNLTLWSENKEHAPYDQYLQGQ